MTRRNLLLALLLGFGERSLAQTLKNAPKPETRKAPESNDKGAAT